jgi:hypothetical protein
MIQKNVGGLDRQLRFVAGTVLVLAAAGALVSSAGQSGLAVVALAGGAGLLFNAVTQRCLANQLLGIDTCTENC